jgi:hypothetical protein
MKTTDKQPTQLDLFAEITRSPAHVKLAPSACPQPNFFAPVVLLHEKRLEKEEQAERRNTLRVLALLDL